MSFPLLSYVKDSSKPHPPPRHFWGLLWAPIFKIINQYPLWYEELKHTTKLDDADEWTILSEYKSGKIIFLGY